MNRIVLGALVMAALMAPASTAIGAGRSVSTKLAFVALKGAQATGCASLSMHSLQDGYDATAAFPGYIWREPVIKGFRKGFDRFGFDESQRHRWLMEDGGCRISSWVLGWGYFDTWYLTDHATDNFALRHLGNTATAVDASRAVVGASPLLIEHAIEQAPWNDPQLISLIERVTMPTALRAKIREIASRQVENAVDAAQPQRAAHAHTAVRPRSDRQIISALNE